MKKMKRISLFTVFMLIISAGILNAQTDQGKVLLGVSSTLSIAGTGSDLMNIGFTSIKQKSDADGYVEADPDKITSINILPKVGYFVVDNFALGLGINVALSSEKDGFDGDKYSQTLLCAEPFARYYIPTSKVLPFFEVSGSYGIVKNKYVNSDNSYEDIDYKSSIMSVGGGIGLAAPLGEIVTFDVLAGYNSMVVKDIKDNEYNNRTIIGTLGLKIGISVLLGGN